MENQQELNDLEVKLFELVVKELAFDHIGQDTPMHEAKEYAAEAGKKFGRLLAVLQHEGEINTDTLMAIRALENQWKARLIDTVDRQLKPGGQVRETWNSGR